MSQWPNWLRRQYGELEICGSNPGYDNFFSQKLSNRNMKDHTLRRHLAALPQMVAYLPLVQQVRGSIPGGLVNIHWKIFNLGARRGVDVHFLITRLYITGLD